MRARLGFAGSIAIGLGVGAALNSATENMGVSIGVGLAVAVVLMVVFTRGGRRQHPDAQDPGPVDDQPRD